MTSASMNAQDDRIVRAYSRRFHNIYLFITESCQLRCGHCYMGGRLDRGWTMPYEKASTVMDRCRRLGAEYLTFVGGEPPFIQTFLVWWSARMSLAIER